MFGLVGSDRPVCSRSLSINGYIKAHTHPPIRRLEVWRRMSTELVGVPCADRVAAMDLSMPAVMDRRLGPLVAGVGPAGAPFSVVLEF